jgi:hypothetical protein
VIGWAAAPPTGQTAKTPTRHLHASKAGAEDPAHRSFQPPLLLPTVRTLLVLFLPLPDGLFHGLAHRLMPSLLNLVFHLQYARVCFDLNRERYLYRHERILLL